MVDFVYTNECRFRYILKYFGEDANTYACGKCDNCLKQNGSLESSIPYIKEKIEDLLNEVLNGISEKQIADILLGIGKNIEQQNNKHFNSLIHYKKEDIAQALRILISDNKIQQKSAGRNKLYFIPDNELTLVPVSETVVDSNKSFEHNIELSSVAELRRKSIKKVFAICQYNMSG